MTEEATVRVLDFDQYRDLLRDFDEHAFDDDSVRWIVGEPAARRDFDDLREEHDLTGERPASYVDDPTLEVSRHKQYGDFGFPTDAFVDSETTSDLKAADPQLVGLYGFPKSAVNELNHRVLTTSDLLEHVGTLEAEYGDDHVLMVGAWSPVGRYQVLNDGDRGVARIGETVFPSNAVAGSGLDGLEKGSSTLAGTLVLERSDLTQDVISLVDDDVSIGTEDADDQHADVVEQGEA